MSIQEEGLACPYSLSPQLLHPPREFPVAGHPPQGCTQSPALEFECLRPG